MNSFSNVADILIILGGALLIYYAEQMRVNDLIKVGFMISPKVNVHKLKDREGFKKYAFPRHFAQGFILVLLGMTGIFCDLYSRGDLHVYIYIGVLVFYVIGNVFIEKGKARFY